MTSENKNLILAIGLSVAVLIGWNYFVGQPQLDKAKQVQQAQTQAAAPGQAPAPGQTAQPGAAPQGQQAPVATPRSRDETIASSKRVKLDTPALAGSIALRGALIDDVRLKGYRETVDPKSPIITLFSPPGTPGAYWADVGFVGAAGQTAKLPTRDVEWTADSEVLTPARPVTLTWDNGEGLVFRRQISVDDKYMLTVKDSVENKGAQPVTFHPYALVARQGKPHTDGYAVLHEGMVGVVGDSRVQEYGYDAIDKEAGQKKTWKGEGGWVGITDKYWGSAVIPDQKASFEGRFSSYGQNVKTYQADVLDDARTVAPGAAVEVTNRIFAGAKETDVIDRYQSALSIKNFDLMIDWGWFYFITKPLFKLIDLIYKFVGNFGVAILIVTLIVKLVFFPLANKSYVSMAKMKAVQPEMESIRTRFADDKAKQQQELMELYKREKINPVAGCLPMIVQIPVFFALYKVIFITIEMRHAPFFGWIRDLSAPDPTSLFNLFGLLPFAVPTFLLIGVWPLLMGVSMFVQMKMNPEPTDPVQKTMFAWMPVIFTFMLGSFPAGLVIYWTWNNILSVAQQGYIMNRQGVKIELWDNLRKMFVKSKSGATTG